jgi:hypothetical protein
MTKQPVSLKLNFTLGLAAALFAAASPAAAQNANAEAAKAAAEAAKAAREQEKAQAEAAKEQAKAQAEQAKAQAEAAKEQAEKLAEQAKAEEEAKEEEAKAEDNDDGKNDFAGEKSPVQSSARPFGLDIVAPVMAAGSDERSAAFQANALPDLNKFLQQSLAEKVAINDSRLLLDPSKLKLQEKSDVRVYFIGEGAGFNNSLGFNTTGTGVSEGDPQLIFPNSSSTVSSYDPAKDPKRTNAAPLLPGDFVNLGRMDAGTMLDFFLIANGASGGSNVFSTDQSANKDGINHVVAFAYAMANSPFLIIGFEDIWGGGDRDFNDILFAVDIGAANIRNLTSTPEPAMATTLLGLLGLAFQRRTRRTTATA